MLPKRFRVHTRADIERVLRKGRSYSSPFFTLRLFIRPDSDGARFGFVVSNKISKRAVVRNRIKRRLREQMRLCGENFSPRADVIVIAKTPAVNATSSDIGKELGLFLQEHSLNGV